MDKILIIDFGSQLTELIARRIRELGVYCEIKFPNIAAKEIINYRPKAIILSGGPASVYAKNAPTIDKKIFTLGIPLLGICYGEQLICKLLGGKVVKAKSATPSREYGKATLEITAVNSPLFAEIKNRNTQIWMSHGDHIEAVPPGFSSIGKTDSTPFAAISDEVKKIYGLQFHPEVVHTLEGANILKNFIFKIAGIQASWTMADFKEQQIEQIKKTVGDKKVICALSGGVDSSVAAALINRAIGKQLICVFVNHGLLRKGEADEVRKVFKENLKLNLIYVDASKIFLSKLKGVTDPEKKRKIIGKAFIEIFDQQASKVKGAEFLAQGTLYPDVIESAHPDKGGSKSIKSHHNVGGLPKKMKLKLLEPLRTLFKDEVRKLGSELGLPDSIVQRHPFPGPGLAIRIISDITKEKTRILQEADFIYINEIKKHGLYREIWQAFCVLLPVKTVGVMGDGRTYENVLALRAVTSVDGMTADVYKFDPDFLASVASKIVAGVRGINRVVYDYTSKPPATIEWE